MTTTKFSSRLTNYLEGRLAPMTAAHGVLVDVYGIGVLIIGKSGVGKSETALELVKKGHRLVADDCVEIRDRVGELFNRESATAVRAFIGNTRYWYYRYHDTVWGKCCTTI
ncbi:HPr kinase/phosphorylase [Lysinibacillus sphaericus]